MAVCPKCNGVGLIDREKSEIDQKEEFAKPLFEKTLCDHCGGSGKEPEGKRSAELAKFVKYSWSGREFEHEVTNVHVFPSILDGDWVTNKPLELQIEIVFRDVGVLDIVEIQKKLVLLNHDTCSVYFDGVCYSDMLLRSIKHDNYKMIIVFMQVIRLTDLQMGGLGVNT